MSSDVQLFATAAQAITFGGSRFIPCHIVSQRFAEGQL